MNTYLKNNLKQALLIIEGSEATEDDFQVSILQENEIPGLLRAKIKYIDDKVLYQYDVSGKVSLQSKHEKTKLSSEDIERFIRALLEVLRVCQKYMLEESGILLSPEYIYCEEHKYFFCYYPPCDLELKQEFHKLTEFLVREVDYQDKEGIHMAYTLHKSSMEENYSVVKIMDEILHEEEASVVCYDTYIEEKVEDNIGIAEKKELWEPIRKLLDRRRKNKEDWEEMFME